MSEASVKIRVASDEKFESYPIQNGLLLLNKDNHSISFDWNGERKIYGDTISVNTIDDLNNIKEPIKGKLYFVENSERFYKYTNGNWSEFDSDSNFLPVEELPGVGEEGKYYIYDNSIYRYDTETQKFVPLNGTPAETEEKFDVIDAELLLLKKTLNENNTTLENIKQTIVQSNEKGTIAGFF